MYLYSTKSSDMKKKLLIIIMTLLNIFIFSQSPVLLSSSWKITQLNVNNQTYYPTMNDKLIEFTNSNFTSTYFNTLYSNITYGTGNQFNINILALTIIDSMDPMIEQFDNFYFETFFAFNNNLGTPNNPFTYQISPDGLSLTIINSLGDIAFYNKSILNLDEINNETSHEMLYPNPASEIIFLKNTKENSTVAIFDSAGRLLQKTLLKNNYLNIETLEKGIYFMQTSEGKIYKFVKK